MHEHYWFLAEGTWRIYAALVLTLMAIVAAAAPVQMFSFHRYLTFPATYLSLGRQARLQRVLAAYESDGRLRGIAYAVAAFALLMAALCLVPWIAAWLPFTAGFAGIVMGSIVAGVRPAGSGARRVATLVRRSVPRSLAFATILVIAGTAGLGLYAPLRLGAVSVAVCMLCLVAFAARMSTAPIRLPGEDPPLEAAVSDLVWLNQVWTIASLIGSLAILNYSLSAMFAMRIQHLLGTPQIGTLQFTEALLVNAMVLPISAGAIMVARLSRKVRSIQPVMNVLEAGPA